MVHFLRRAKTAWVGGTTLAQMVLSCIRKQAEQVMESSVSNGLFSIPAMAFLHDGL